MKASCGIATWLLTVLLLLTVPTAAYAANITSHPQQGEPVAATSMKLPKDFRLEEGATKYLHVELLPADTTDRVISWSSSDKGVATVRDGVVRAVSEGKTTVKAETSNGLTAQVQVTVYRIEPTAVTTNKERYLVEIIGNDRVQAETVPANATDPTLQMEIIDPEIAEIAKDGTITPKKVGKTKIIITASNGTKKEVPLEVFVVPAEEIQLKVPEADLKTTSKGYRVKPEMVLTVLAKVLPENVSYPGLTWESSDPAVAMVQEGTIEFIKAGSVTIRCLTEDGVEKELYFEVYDATGTIIAIIVASAALLVVFYALYNRAKRRRKALRQEQQALEELPRLQNDGETTDKTGEDQ